MYPVWDECVSIYLYSSFNSDSHHNQGIMQMVFLFLGGLGGWEVFLIIAVLVLLFGAKKIPELARGMGRGIREFKDATREIKDEIDYDGNDDRNRNTNASAANRNTADQAATTSASAGTTGTTTKTDQTAG